MPRKSVNPTPRRRPSRDTKPVTYVFCEGEKTEPTYFSRWRERGMSLHIIKVSHTDPCGIIKDAQEIISGRSFEPSQGDSVWCVYDVDANSNATLAKAAALAKRNRFDIAVSNPCFELWYILHFELQGGSMTSSAAIGKISSHVAGYTKNMDVFDTLSPRIQVALANAAKIERRYGQKIDPLQDRSCNPFTNVDVLVQKLQAQQEKALRRTER